MFCGVSDNGKQNETDEGLGDVGSLDYRIDGVDKVFGTHGYQDRSNNKNTGGCPGTHLGYFWFVFLSWSLGIKEACVGS